MKVSGNAKLELDEQPKKELDLSPYLASYEEKFSFLKEMVHGLVNTNVVNALLASGPPGIGKTYTIDEILLNESENEQRPIQYKRVSGKITPLAFYELLCANSGPDCVIFFDDADSILVEPISLNLLKSATEKRPQRVITYNSTRLDNKSTVFEGKIVIATNVRFARNPHFAAIVDRFHVFDMSVSYMEKLAKIYDIAKKDKEHLDLSKKVIDYLAEKEEVVNQDKITIRTFIKLRELAELMPEKWQRFAALSGTYFESV